MNDKLMNDINRLKEILSPMYNLCKQEQDFFRFLVTLNASTLLILIAFSEKLIKIPLDNMFAIIPFILFAFSLCCSIYMTRIIGDINNHIIQWHIDLIDAMIKEDFDKVMSTNEIYVKRTSKVGRRANFFQIPALWFFFFGMAFLIIFAIFNLIKN